MGEWIIGALINLIGSLAINFGTNLLKLGHDERERMAMLDDGIKNPVLKPIIYFQTWRIGIIFFAVGNFLNFVSFGYAAQSLLAALGSIQFISNIAFAYFVLKKTVSGKVLIATLFIVLGNVFLVAFGNHQSPVYTPDQLAEKYSNLVFLLYCFTLVLIVAANHIVYRKNEMWNLVSEHSNSPYWRILLPFCYATVSGAVGSCSVLFAKSLSNLLRLSMSGGYQLNSWFTYSMLLLFLSTAGFWMTRLNEGLSLYDAILAVPMFQIAWTFFSICTGFVYFQEYQVFDALRTIMFLLGMSCVFIGISLLAPNDTRGEIKDSSFTSTTSPHIATDVEGLIRTTDTDVNTPRSFKQAMLTRATSIVLQAKTACTLSLGLGEDSINASSVLVMPLVSSKMTGFRGNDIDRIKLSTPRSGGWMMNSIDEFDDNILESSSLLEEISH